MRETLIEVLMLLLEITFWIACVGLATAPLGHLAIQIIDDLKNWRRNDDDV